MGCINNTYMHGYMSPVAVQCPEYVTAWGSTARTGT